MISNMQQHQQFESVVMEPSYPSAKQQSTVVVVDKYVNNNSNNMNRNINFHRNNHQGPTAVELLTTSPDADMIIFDPAEDYDINSSLNTKEITIAASQTIYDPYPVVVTTAAAAATTTKTLPSLSSPSQPLNTTNKGFTTITFNKRTNGGLINFGQASINGGSHHSVSVKTVSPKLMTAGVNRQNVNRCHEYALKSPVSRQKMNGATQEKISSYNNHNTNDDLRRIKDVHNYSKTNRGDYSTNSSSQEDDDEDDDTEDDIDDDVFAETNLNRPRTTSPSKNYIANHHYERNSTKPLAYDHIEMQANHKKNHQNTKSTSSISETTSMVVSSTMKPITTLRISPVSPNSPDSSQRGVTGVCATDVPDDNVDNGDNFGGIMMNGGDKSAPDHHARRPMNAFLIFCKRHRAIVRDKYKNLENRQITKILGEWWATLSNCEKAEYTDLAKQYKDAFFKANPNFKWYKLPAPPIRTCSSRPGSGGGGQQSPNSPTTPNHHHHMSCPLTPTMNDGGSIESNGYDRFNCDNECVRNYSSSSFHSSVSNHTNSMVHDSRNGSNNVLYQKKWPVGLFRLADEAQMGGLNSLMGGVDGNNKQTDAMLGTNNANDNNSQNGINYKNEALQNALSETSKFFSHTMPNSKDETAEPFANMRNHAAHMEASHQMNGKRECPFDTTPGSPNKKPHSPIEGQEYMLPKKASRSCKGKRYEELKISGQIIPSNKKASLKVRTNSATSPVNGFYRSFDHSLEYCGDTNLANNHDQNLNRPLQVEKMDIIIPDQHTSPGSANSIKLESPNSQKQFDASDFDLEEKIKALPAQCLESYLKRKRETKKKKKISSKRRTTSSTSSTAAIKSPCQLSHPLFFSQNETPPKTIQEARERIQCAAVGSQKRKARKESITRRDVSAMNGTSPVDLMGSRTNSLFEAVELVQIKTENIKSDPDSYLIADGYQSVGGLMTIIKEEPGNDASSNHIVHSTPTSDLLILAEVATNHITNE